MKRLCKYCGKYISENQMHINKLYCRGKRNTIKQWNKFNKDKILWDLLVE